MAKLPMQQWVRVLILKLTMSNMGGESPALNTGSPCEHAAPSDDDGFEGPAIPPAHFLSALIADE